MPTRVRPLTCTHTHGRPTTPSSSPVSPRFPALKRRLSAARRDCDGKLPPRVCLPRACHWPRPCRANLVRGPLWRQLAAAFHTRPHHHLVCNGRTACMPAGSKRCHQAQGPLGPGVPAERITALGSAALACPCPKAAATTLPPVIAGGTYVPSPTLELYLRYKKHYPCCAHRALPLGEPRCPSPVALVPRCVQRTPWAARARAPMGPCMRGA